MTFHLIPVTIRAHIRKFIYLPSKLHKDYLHFVPPLYSDEFSFHTAEKNLSWKKNEVIRILLENDGKLVGRIMGIIPSQYNKINNENTARFYQFDCINNESAARTLFDYIEKWAYQKGMNRVIGSFGFSDKDPQGIQIEGFHHPPVIASVSHQPYLGNLVTSCGYIKFKDCISYRAEVEDTLPIHFSKIYNRILLNHKLKLLEFKCRKALKPFIVPIMYLMNQGYRDIYGFESLTESEIYHLSNQYFNFLDPELIKIVVNENMKPVAFVLAMPNISRGIKQAKGKLFPFGIIPVYMALKKSNQLDLLLGAVDESYRGRGLNILMGIALMKSAKLKGMNIIDSHLILEENKLMRSVMENLGGVIYKRYRIFQKDLV